DRGAGREPGGVLETDALEGEVVRRAGVAAAADVQQRGQPGQFDVVRAGRPAGGRLVVELSGRRVDEPLPGGVEEGVGVLQIQLAAGVGALDRVVAPVVVLPGRLLHGDGRAADALHGRVVVGEGVLRLQLDPALLRQVGEVVQVRVPDGHAGAGERDVGAGDGDRGPRGERAVDVELARVDAGGDRRGPDVVGRVVQRPAGDLLSPGEYRRLAGGRLPGDGESVAARVRGGEGQRRGEAVGASGQLDHDVAGHVAVDGLDGRARLGQRARRGGRAGGAAAGRGHEEGGGGGGARSRRDDGDGAGRGGRGRGDQCRSHGYRPRTAGAVPGGGRHCLPFPACMGDVRG